MYTVSHVFDPNSTFTLHKRFHPISIQILTQFDRFVLGTHFRLTCVYFRVILLTGSRSQNKGLPMTKVMMPHFTIFEKWQAKSFLNIRVKNNIASEILQIVVSELWLWKVELWLWKVNHYFAFVAPFFVNCISEQDLDEMNVELIRNTLYKVTLSNSLLILLEWQAVPFTR